MSSVKIWQLHLLRAMYLFIALGLGVTIWPEIIVPPSTAIDPHSVIRSILGAFSLLALLGLRYPLQMLPLLLIELLWKSIWMIAYAFPAWQQPGWDAYAQSVFIACISGVVLTPLVVPWNYVMQRYVKTAGDPWRKQQPHTGAA